MDVPQLQLNCMRAGALAFQAVEVEIGRLCGVGISRCPPEPVRVTCNVGTYYTIEPGIAPERRRDHQRLKSGGVGHSLTELSDARRYRSWRAVNRVDPAHRVRAERRRRKTHPPLVRRLAFRSVRTLVEHRPSCPAPRKHQGRDLYIPSSRFLQRLCGRANVKD
jgi:hypothetical protein